MVLFSKDGIIGAAHQDKPLPYTLKKPVAVEGGDICSLSGIQYHKSSHHTFEI